MDWLNVVLLLMVLLFAVGSMITGTCGAETRRRYQPCRNISPGPYNKCHHHRGPGSTRADVWGLALYVLGIGLLILWLSNHGLQHLLEDLSRR